MYNEYSVDEVLELLKSLPKDKAKSGIYLELCILFFSQQIAVWLQFVVFEIDKTASKHLNEEHGHLENEELEAFKKVILVLL